MFLLKSITFVTVALALVLGFVQLWQWNVGWMDTWTFYGTGLVALFWIAFCAISTVCIGVYTLFNLWENLEGK